MAGAYDKKIINNINDNVYIVPQIKNISKKTAAPIIAVKITLFIS
jgi:hypothetical protein